VFAGNTNDMTIDDTDGDLLTAAKPARKVCKTTTTFAYSNDKDTFVTSRDARWQHGKIHCERNREL